MMYDEDNSIFVVWVDREAVDELDFAANESKY